MRLLALVGLFAGIATQAQPTHRWDLNDVSYLFALPKSADTDFLLSPQSRGAGGELLSKLVFTTLPTLDFEDQDTTYAHMRVVGARIDPCFPGLASGLPCRRQLRLIWQPLITGNATATMDAAVHTFYDLNAAEFADLLTSLQRLKAASGVSTEGLPLGVHPAILKEGAAGPFMTGLRQVILKFAGPMRLTRVTFMQLSGAGNVWNFGGFDVLGDQMQAMEIPRVSSTLQTFFNSPITPNYYSNSGAVPEAPGDDTFNLLIRDSRKAQSSDEPGVILASRAIYRSENPKIQTPASLDCVSCHASQAARIWSETRYPWLMLEPRNRDVAFQSSMNLQNTSVKPGRTDVLRSFGYMGTDVAISQRTINESAEVTAALNAGGLPAR